MLTVGYIVAGIFVYTLIFYYTAHWRKPKFGKRLPGPRNLPFFGSALQIGFWNLKHKNYDLFTQFCKKYGPLVGLQAGLQSLVLVEDYETARAILNSEEWAERMPDHDMYRLITFKKNLGIMFGFGESYAENRRFVLRHLRDFGFGTKSKMEGILTREVEHFISSFDKLREKNRDEICFYQCFKLSALNLLWVVLCGSRVSEDDEHVKYLISRAERTIANISIGSQPKFAFPFLRHIPHLTDTQDQVEGIAFLHQLFREILEKRRDLGEYKVAKNDFIDLYLSKIDETNNNPNSTFTDEQLIASCSDMFMAGTGTVGDSLEFAILYMLKFPEIQKKVHEEIDRVVPYGQIPVLSDRESMPYIEAVLLETMRFCPVIPIIPRSCAAEAETLINGYYIPKKTMAIINNYRISHDEKIWDAPSEFRPERFLDENMRIRKETANKLLAFGAGIRVCAGVTSARMSLFSFFTAFLHRYTIEPCEKYPDVSLKAVVSGINNQPKPFYARVKLRQPRRDWTSNDQHKGR